MQSAPKDSAVLAGGCDVEVAAPIDGSVNAYAHIRYGNAPSLISAQGQLTQGVGGAAVDCEPDSLSNRRAAV